ncbi:hypothetical protein PI124_g557 [Phytophthora idaei]|nr:hypothetical protein PI125_g9866 [Phytophthora idaei]KAG3152330.1 hypothetical protein PI126_g10577 [Phytophthora idaei]KAG3254886.1 hypothetical protein PI124_g557 [Phytophthora idaei]
MEIRRPKDMAPLVETAERMEGAEAMKTTAAEAASEAKVTTEAKDTPVAQLTAPNTEAAIHVPFDMRLNRPSMLYVLKADPHFTIYYLLDVLKSHIENSCVASLLFMLLKAITLLAAADGTMRSSAMSGLPRSLPSTHDSTT